MASGKASARLLSCKSGSKASSRIQLLIGFLVSGLTHVCGDAAVGLQYIGYSLPFFIVQALAMMLEDEVIATAKKARPGIERARWVRAVGYAWTLGWVLFSWPLFTWWKEEARSTRGRSDEVTFSVIHKMLALFRTDA